MSMSGPPTGYGREMPAFGETGNGLRFSEAYSFFFQNPNWGMNLLCTTVCQLIPVVGPIVLLGYEYELIEALHRDPRRIYPDFDFNRFVNYLSRGVWPFLVSLIAVLVIFPVVWVAMMLGTFGIAAAAESEAGILVFFVAIIMFVGVMLLSCAVSVIMVPMVLRAGLSQDFAQAFQFGFIRDYFQKMWLETLLASLFVMGTGMVLMMVGMVACFIGMYPAMTLMLLAQTHLHYQLYELYLRRGGQVIPLKAPAV